MTYAHTRPVERTLLLRLNEGQRLLHAARYRVTFAKYKYTASSADCLQCFDAVVGRQKRHPACKN